MRRWLEQQLDVSPQMINALRRNCSTAPGLGQDERALDGGLRVERQALRGPLRMHAALAHGFLYIRDKSPRVPGDAAVAVQCIDHLRRYLELLFNQRSGTSLQ